jgi:hypothetical protein
MADTVNCYNDGEICEECEKNTVQNIHIGTLSEYKPKKLCNQCFKKIIEDKK